MAATITQFAMFAADCPRCGQSKTTFDIRAAFKIRESSGWDVYEAFLVCRSCFKSSIAELSETTSKPEGPASLGGQYINWAFRLERWVFEVPNRRSCPTHVPGAIQRIFDEAATCAAIGAWDASGTMFRKVLDAATRSIAPKPDSTEEPRPANWKTYKDLRLRLDWLFSQNLLSRGLKDLSSCIHEDGNDAAHDLTGISEAEAQDLGDFSERVLEILYTLPGQIEENRRRRDERRAIKESQPAEG
jgi:hypothetical protein